MASVPSMAFGSPPLTGASRNSTPPWSQAAPIFCDEPGAIELMSITALPLPDPSSTPPAPRIAASESLESGTIVMTTSVCAATSFAEAAFLAPSLTSSSTEAATTSNTVTSYPAFIRLRAIGLPIIPKPTKPTFFAITFSFELTVRAKV
jgi:hypothetical protein